MATDLKYYLLYYVLVHALFITVHADVQVQCQNQSGILGKPLNLTCLVTHSEKNDCMIKDNKMCSKDLPEKCTKCTCNLFTCYHAIPRTEKNHNETFTFWVQTNCGFSTTEFTVNLGSQSQGRVTVHPTTVDPTTVNTESELHKVIGDNGKQMNGSSKAAMAIVLVILALALPTIALVALKRSQCGSALFGRVKNYVHSSQSSIV